MMSWKNSFCTPNPDPNPDPNPNPDPSPSLRDDELEELLLHAALVDALLAHELHLERLLQVLLAQGHLQQPVRDEIPEP